MSRKPFFVREIVDFSYRYWSEKYNCSVLPAYDLRKGAGTLNPHILLSILNPKSNVFVPLEKSCRYDDCLNLNIGCRLSTHHQLEVIIHNHEDISLLELVGDFTRELGLSNLTVLDDNWEHELLLAKGLGFECCSSNLEFLQATYFYELGGIALETRPLELAFGVERLGMLVQKVISLHDLMWDETQSYMDLFGRFEVESSFFFCTPEQFQVSKNMCLQYIEQDRPILALEELLNASNLLNKLRLTVFSDDQTRSSILDIQHYAKLIFKKLYS